MAGYAVEITDLEFSWREAPPAFHIPRFTLDRGERVLLRGPSGSGKSTLLGLIGGVLTPRAGTLRVLGEDLLRMTAAQRDRFRGEHIGFLFQMFNLIPYLSVVENVLLPAQFSARRRARIAGKPHDEAVRLLEALGIAGADVLGRTVTELSIGQQQRVAAARALLGKPELILADEPTSALDSQARANFLQLLMAECSSRGATLLLASHDESIAPLFDRSAATADLTQTRLAAA